MKQLSGRERKRLLTNSDERPAAGEVARPNQPVSQYVRGTDIPATFGDVGLDRRLVARKLHPPALGLKACAGRRLSAGSRRYVPHSGQQTACADASRSSYSARRAGGVECGHQQTHVKRPGAPASRPGAPAAGQGDGSRAESANRSAGAAETWLACGTPVSAGNVIDLSLRQAGTALNAEVHSPTRYALGRHEGGAGRRGRR
jgi:hypothetical protein